MSNMLGKSDQWFCFTDCCSHCARGRNWKPGKRARRRARSLEGRQWRKDRS